MSRRTFIAACAPVPIDDLTVDQIAGPYLEADIYKRHLAQLGLPAQYVVAIDENHSQIDVLARELRLPTEAIVGPARSAIEASLQAYSIGVDQLGRHDLGYEPFARSVFGKLFDAGALAIRETSVLYELKSGRYPSDAWVRGSCPWCLDAASGGACESCGAPNGSFDLLALDPQRYALRPRRRLVLDLERMRDELEQHLTVLCTPRAPLGRMIREALARPLEPVVLSTEGGRGLALDFLGLPEQRLHPTAEMFAALRYGLEAAAGPVGEGDTLVRFAGLGKAYLHAFVHGALAGAAVRCGLTWPAAGGLLTSQLRPSRGARAVIWARELTDVFSADAVRAYLATIGSDYSEAHFVRSALDSSIAQITASIDRLVQLWNQQRHQPEASRAQHAPRDVVGCMERPLSLEDFSSAELARRTFNCLDHFASKVARPRSGLTRYIPNVLAVALEPLCPNYASQVRERFPAIGRRWNDLKPCGLDRDLPHFESRLADVSLDGATTLARLPLTAAS